LRQLAAAGSEPGIFANKSASDSHPLFPAPIEHNEAVLRLIPRARVGSSLSDMGWAHFFARRFDEAVPKLLLAIQEDPSLPVSYQLLAACHAHMGRLHEAREVVGQLRAITLVVIPDASFLRNAEHRELFLSGLRLAAGDTR
jgi:adenylate cyclase